MHRNAWRSLGDLRRSLHGLLPVMLMLLAHAAAAASYTPPRTLEQWSDRARVAGEKQGEQWTVLVEDLYTDQPLYSYQSDQRLAPASNRKLFTMALALDYLGPDFQFVTEFGLNQPRESGQAHYHGDLVLRSAGDPSLNSPYMEQPGTPTALLTQWAEAVHAAGIAYVHGDLIIDASAFGATQVDYPEVWEAHHKNYAYAPIPTALAVNENLLQVTVRPGSRTGYRGRVSIAPWADGLAIDNATQTASSGSNGVSASFDEANPLRLLLKGRLRVNSSAEVALVPLTRPLQYIGQMMETLIEREGVKVTGSVLIKTERNANEKPVALAEVLGRHEAPPLSRLLLTMMRNSNNFMAEQIWAGTAANVAGVGDRATARRIEQQWLSQNRLGWIEPGWDGSGLSRQDQHSAQEMVLIARHLYESPFRALLIDCLPESGVRGTLRNRSFSNDEGRVIAKTGTLSGVSALTGFIRDAKKQPRLVFSVIGNAPGNSDSRLAMRITELVRILIDDLDAGRLNVAEINDLKIPINRKDVLSAMPVLPAAP